VSAGARKAGEGWGALSAVPLFAGIPAADLERLEHFMARFEVAAGERLFGQGDDASCMYVVESGSLEIRAELTGGKSKALARTEADGLLGEISLLVGGTRTATAVACEPTSGWVLYRSGFQMLRLDGTPGSVELMARLTELAVKRLRDRYEAIAADLVSDATAGEEVAMRAPTVAAARELASAEYVRGLLCFRDFHDDEQIAAALGGAKPVELERGAYAVEPDSTPRDLLLVLRGALDVSVRKGAAAQRVRLAGPGRFVGHVGVLDGGSSPVVAHTRERVVMVELPGERVRAMLRDPSAPARRFSAAVAEDVARALRQAERPMARTWAASATQLEQRRPDLDERQRQGSGALMLS